VRESRCYGSVFHDSQAYEYPSAYQYPPAYEYSPAYEHTHDDQANPITDRRLRVGRSLLR
jgi:hypothetical protein